METAETPCFSILGLLGMAGEGQSVDLLHQLAYLRVDKLMLFHLVQILKSLRDYEHVEVRFRPT